MSKPDATGTHNLDEILASIRRSLTEQSPSPAATSPAQPAPAATVRPPEGAQNEGLSNRLAGALKGAGTSLDEALAEFFAHVPRREAPERPAPAAPADGATGKDPFWFLTRERPEPASTPAQVRAPSAPSAPEEIKLSRPETLRPSLPPLFVAEVASPRAPSSAPANSASDAPAPSPEPGAAALERDPTGTSGHQPGGSNPPVAAATAVPALEVPRDAQTHPPEPDPARMSGKASRAPSAPESASEPAAASAAPAAVEVATAAPGGAQTHALEELIAQLLEPVLVRWLDENLPRMIENVVRAEIARVRGTSG